MKLLILSDIHIEFDKAVPKHDRFVLPDGLDFDVMVLAGDIHVGRQAFEYIDKWDQQYPGKHFIYVSGNHEYYGKEMLELEKAFRKSEQSRKEKGIKIDYLQYGQSVQIQDVEFIGGTLWTDFDKQNPMVMWDAEKSMSDYRVIKYGKFNISSQKILGIFQQTLQEIVDRIKNPPPGGKRVIVTHHAPSWQSVETKYKGSSLNGAYCSDLDYLMYDYHVDVWIHGHMHQSHDYMINNTRVIANPRGYVGHELNPEFEFKIINL